MDEIKKAESPKSEIDILRAMHQLRERGTLPGGLIVAGRVYREFSIGLDDGNLFAELDQMEGLEGNQKRLAAQYARRLQFDGLPERALTYQAILDLKGPDWSELHRAALELSKKYATFRG